MSAVASPSPITSGREESEVRVAPAEGADVEVTTPAVDATDSTTVAKPARCLWCRRSLPEAKPSGRPRRYCRQSCRQRAYEARRHAEELGLSDEQLVVTRAELERMYDLAYHLQGAVTDTDRALASGANRSAEELSQVLEDLLRACRPIVDQPLL